MDPSDLIRKNYATDMNGNLGTKVEVRFESLKNDIEKEFLKLQKDLSDARESNGWAQSIFEEIHNGLAAKGVPMDACPPMMYPEAIHNLAAWVAKTSRDCWRDHEWHKDDGKAFSKCMLEGIQRYAAAAASRFDNEKKKGKS